MLHILDAICARELDGRESQARHAIENAVRLSKDCFFGNFMNAWSHIEQLPLPANPAFRPLRSVVKRQNGSSTIAIEGRARRPTLALAGVVVGAVGSQSTAYATLVPEIRNPTNRDHLDVSRIEVDRLR